MNRVPTDAEVLDFYQRSIHGDDKTAKGFAPHTPGRAEYCSWYLETFVGDGFWNTKKGVRKDSHTECRDRAIYHLEKALNRERRRFRQEEKRAERTAAVEARRLNRTTEPELA